MEIPDKQGMPEIAGNIFLVSRWFKELFQELFQGRAEHAIKLSKQEMADETEKTRRGSPVDKRPSQLVS